MGSNGDVIPNGNGAEDAQEEITVLVTGFAPFRPQNPLNPAWEITRALPPYLPPGKEPPPLATFVQSLRPVPPFPRVRILIYPEPIRVSYKTVRELVPNLWDIRVGKLGNPIYPGLQSPTGGEPEEGKKLDFVIHIGMASGRKFYSIERLAHREGYLMKDVDGELLWDDGGVTHKPPPKQPSKDEDIVMSNNPIDTPQPPIPTSHPELNSIERRKDNDLLTISTTEEDSDPPTTPDGSIGPWISKVGQVGNELTRQRTLQRLSSTSLTSTPPSTNPSSSQPTPDPHWIWAGLPKEIHSDLNIDQIWRNWRLAIPEIDARISIDPGRYLCDFIYYSSLAELTKREERKRVLFLHVPVESDEDAVKRGVNIVVELIRSMVNAMRAGKMLFGGDGFKKKDPRAQPVGVESNNGGGGGGGGEASQR